MREEDLRHDIARYREQWRGVRERRLSLKADLAGSGLGVDEVRAHREYRRLKKEQRRLSVLIRQRERALHRRGGNGHEG
jgi:hypothetical protein